METFDILLQSRSEWRIGTLDRIFFHSRSDTSERSIPHTQQTLNSAYSSKHIGKHITNLKIGVWIRPNVEAVYVRAAKRRPGLPPRLHQLLKTRFAVSRVHITLCVSVTTGTTGVTSVVSGGGESARRELESKASRPQKVHVFVRLHAKLRIDLRILALLLVFCLLSVCLWYELRRRPLIIDRSCSTKT